jgi:hypothetical protein
MSEMPNFDSICSGHIYQIPLNQRGFSWEVKNLKELLEDLSLAGTDAHFMGTIVATTIEGGNIRDCNNASYSRWRLDDGQQRITALMILVNEISKKLLELGGDNEKQVANEINKLLFIEKTEGVKSLTLENLNEELHNYLSFILLGTPPRPAEISPPMKALDKVRDYAKEVVNSKAKNDLISLKNQICTNLKFNLVDLANAGINRHLAFDAINSRGLPLSEFDKIKNFCGLLHSKCTLKLGRGLSPEKIWYKALTSLEAYNSHSRLVETKFITELFKIFHNKEVTSANVHKDFVEIYKPLLTSPDPVQQKTLSDFIASWRKYADIFGFYESPDRSNHYGGEGNKMCPQKAGGGLDKINYSGYSTITRSIICASIERFKTRKNGYTAAELHTIIDLCEKFTFRVYGIIGKRTNTYQKQILEAAHNIFIKKKKASYVIKQLVDWTNALAPMKLVLQTLGNGDPKYPNADVTGWNSCYYFLYEYELGNSSTGSSGAVFQWGENSSEQKDQMEHILVQSYKTNSWWKTHWGNDEKCEKYVHRLGNLVLTSNNQTLGDKSFIDKLGQTTQPDHCYSHRNATNTEKLIKEYTDGQKNWKSINIEYREIDMIRWAAGRWSMGCKTDNINFDLGKDEKTSNFFREAKGNKRDTLIKLNTRKITP